MSNRSKRGGVEVRGIDANTHAVKEARFIWWAQGGCSRYVRSNCVYVGLMNNIWLVLHFGEIVSRDDSCKAMARVMDWSIDITQGTTHWINQHLFLYISV